MNVQISRASDADGPSILQLLRDSGLPVDGLVDHLNTAFVARDDIAIVGCAAVEIYADGARLAVLNPRNIIVERTLFPGETYNSGGTVSLSRGIQFALSSK
jgi:N-acetylglutamate synthase-like GNAT family acetyltransferase